MAQNYTYPSLPAIAVGLKDAEAVSTEFVYNFFMADERVNETSGVTPMDNVTDHASFASKIGKLPRFIELSFTLDSGVRSRNIGLTNVIKNGSPILYEDAPFNTNLSSIVVADTLADSRSYMISSASRDFAPSDIELSETSTTLRTNTSAAISSKSFIFNALNNIQTAGYQYAMTDVSEFVSDQFLSNVRGFSSGLSLSNLFIGDIANRILENENSIFADEFAAAIDRSNYIQSVTRESVTTHRVPSTAYDQTVPFYDYQDIELKSGLEDLSLATIVTHVGYIIEKFGQNVDGSVTVYDNIYVDDPKVTAISDPNVRYGGLYSYTVRAVYDVSIVVASETAAGKPVGITRAKMLIATTGKNVDRFCEESVPPQPPEDVFFNFMPSADLFVGWKFPFNKQRDIKKFQVFRRKTIKEAFTLVQEINFDDSVIKSPSNENIPAERIFYTPVPTCFYIDQDFDVNSKYIYAIVSVDAHGYTSNYSTQFEVSVNIFTETLIIKDVVRKGCPKPYPNLLLEQDFFVDLLKDSGHTQMKVFFNPDYTDLIGTNGRPLGVIKYDNKQPTYKLHILETNLAQDNIVNITLSDEKIPITIPISEAKVYTQVR